MSEMRRVTAICNGTVIDHVPGGQALRVLRMLRITGSQSNPVSLVMNVPSSKHGSKDIIKVEDRELTQDELDRLALIAPAATVSIIRNFTVAEKRVVELGDEMVNVATATKCIIRGWLVGIRGGCRLAPRCPGCAHSNGSAVRAVLRRAP